MDTLHSIILTDSEYARLKMILEKLGRDRLYMNEAAQLQQIFKERDAMIRQEEPER